MKFLPGSRGAQEEREMQFASQFLFFCSHSNSFLDSSIFLFQVNICSEISKKEFRKDKLHKGIKFIFQNGIQKILSDSEAMLQTCE